MLAEEGYTDEGVELRFAADLRYVGQSSELTIPFDPETVLAGGFTSLAVRFYEDYHATYGYATDEAVELAALRLTAVGRAELLAFRSARVDYAAVRGATGERDVHY